jgi:hypothetical protein
LRFTAIGLGEDVRISGPSVAGDGLMVDGKLVHLVAFPASERAMREPVEEVFQDRRSATARFSRRGSVGPRSA